MDPSIEVIAAWLEEARRGQHALAELYTVLERSLLPVLKRTAPSDAEDIFQETWLRLLQRIVAPRDPLDPTNFQGYAAKIARRLIQKLGEDRLRRKATELTEDARTGRDAAESQLIWADTCKAILKELPPQDQVRFHWFFIEERTNEELSRTWGISITAVRKQRSRLLEKLKAIPDLLRKLMPIVV